MSSNDVLIQWCKIWINWQYNTELEWEENFREIFCILRWILKFLYSKYLPV